MRSVQAFLKKSFSFLENGFTRKISSVNSEVGILFTNKSMTIEVMSYYAVDGKHHIDVAIEKNGVRKNILDFNELFSEVQLHGLKSKIIGKNVEEQIMIYAKFIEENITKLR